MNAVVLTAVLCCLNSGMYTASRMLFVLAARSEAPPQLVRVTRRGVPANAILSSSIVGFLCVIAAAFSPDTIFAFLLNSSGAIILFVYLLIAISQIVLRYRTPDADLRVKMWLFPVLSILTTVAMRGDPRADVLRRDTALAAAAEPAVLGGGAGAVLRQQVVRETPPERRQPSAAARSRTGFWSWPTRQLDSNELLDELRRIGADTAAKYFVVVPANPIDTGAAATHGPLDVRRPPNKLLRSGWTARWPSYRSENLDAHGALGDSRPLRALSEAVDSFEPDRIVIATLPPEFSVWHRFDVVDRARAQHGLPVTHVVAHTAAAGRH